MIRSSPSAETRWTCYRWWSACCGLFLLAATWRLWIPQGEFPQIPLFAWACSAGLWWDRVALGLMVVALIGSIKWPKAWFLFSLGWLVSVILNQHRLQPWAYQLALLAALFPTFAPRKGLRWVRLIVCGIYIYSALSKFDAQFVNTLGQDFLSQVSNWFSVELSQWNPRVRQLMALVFPVCELAVGIALMIPRMQSVGCWGATGMHLVLLLILGPWGLNHRLGVLLWNVFFLGQVWLIFGTQSDERGSLREQYRGPVWVQSLLVFAFIWPLGERLGYCDHWLAWGLYAPHSSRTDWLLTKQGVALLKDPLRAFVEPTKDGQPQELVEWWRFSLEKYSLERLGVPLYPHARFQFGVARRLMQEHQATGQSRLIVRGTADRWTGQREQVMIDSEVGKLPTWWWNIKSRRL